MYKGTNPTAIKSQNAIKDALFSLIEEKPQGKIAVKELCEKAGVSRQTFYQLFESVDDVIRFYLNGVFEAFINEMKKRKSGPLKEFFIDFYFEFFTKQPGFTTLCGKCGVSGLLTELFAGYLAAYHNEYHKEENARLNEYAHIFLAGALTQTLIYWIKSGSDAEPGELASVIEKILNGRHFAL